MKLPIFLPIFFLSLHIRFVCYLKEAGDQGNHHSGEAYHPRTCRRHEDAAVRDREETFHGRCYGNSKPGDRL